MDSHWFEFLGLLLRWLHVIAGIAWIGSSFYFIWLDHSLEPPQPDSELAKKGVSGDLWAVHGGGFYNPQKYAVAPASLPTNLHWFKWEAYTTWLSGTALLVVVYWLHAGTMMLASGSVLEPWKAVALGAGCMVGSWIVYDLLCKSPLGKKEGLLSLAVFGGISALAWFLCREFGGRAAYIHVGTSIGTIMVANVFFVIIPGQKRMVDAMRAGKLPNPIDGKRAKQRSVHNNYFTLPVIFIMISNHYPMTYGHPYAWAILVLISAAGVSIRHFFNQKHYGIYAWHYLAIGAVMLVAAAWWTAPHEPDLPPVQGPVTFDRVRKIVGERCVTCHSATPTFPGITQPPAGVILTAPELIVQNSQRIYQQAVITQIMPLGNATHITQEERAVIAAWVRKGAPLQ